MLRWLTGAADAIPLLDLDRGRYVGARLYFARTDDELRQVRGWARHGIAQHGDLPADIPRWKAERPWQWPTSWFDAAWLRGTIAYLDWILGDTQIAPVTRQPKPIAPGPTRTRASSLASARCTASPQAGTTSKKKSTPREVGLMQGHEGEEPADPDRYPPPQWCEGVVQAHDWATGEDGEPPADHHGCGAYYPCPGDRRCYCEAAGHCLRGQCPACTDRICNAGWTALVENYCQDPASAAYGMRRLSVNWPSDRERPAPADESDPARSQAMVQQAMVPRCRIQPYQESRRRHCAVPGPASAPGSALGGPPGARRASTRSRIT